MNNAAEMSHRAVIHVLCVLGVFQKGLTALVQTQQTVMAVLGNEACLNCQLSQSKDVLQVTWQKPLSEGEKTLAIHNKHFGPRVNPDFIDKVEFKDAGLQNNSIVIRNLTEQDEGCYQCLFNMYPVGALTGITCIKLYELHEPILHVRESNSPEESVVSCSATGRPAPTVTLRVLQQDLHFSNYSSDSVTNTNGTVAVTTTAVLSGYRGNSPEVGCAARVISGPQIEVFMMIPEVKQSSADGFDQSGSKDRDRNWTLIIVFSVVGLVCGHIAAFFYFCKPKSESQSMRADKCSALTASSSSSLSHGELEMNEITNNTQKAEASSVTQESDGVRQRPSPGNAEPSDNPNPSPSTSV